MPDTDRQKGVKSVKTCIRFPFLRLNCKCTALYFSGYRFLSAKLKRGFTFRRLIVIEVWSAVFMTRFAPQFIENFDVVERVAYELIC